MKKTVLDLALSATLFALCMSARGAAAKESPADRVSSGFDPATDSARAEGIRQALRELGYIEGQNIAIEYRYAEGKRDRLPEHAAELLRLKVDLILAAGGPPSIQAAKNATKTIPIVMVGTGIDPVEAGFIESLARPGSNVTGITNLSRELGGKRLELLKEAVPKLARVTVLYDPATSGHCTRGERGPPGRGACAGVDFRSWEVRDTDGFRESICCVKQGAPGWTLCARPGSPNGVNEKRIADFALKSRFAVYLAAEGFVDAGGLMSYGADLADSYRRVAISWTEFSKEPSLAIYPWSSRRNLSL